MCGPLALPIATLCITAASAVASGLANEQQMQAQEAYQEAQAKEYSRVADLNNKAAAQEYVNQSAAESIQQMQEQAATSRQMQEVQKESLQRQGTMIASTNAAGGVFNALMADLARQEANQKDTMREQYEMQGISHQLNTQAMREKAQNRINSQQSYIAQNVSGGRTLNTISTILGISSGANKAGQQYYEYNKK